MIRLVSFYLEVIVTKRLLLLLIAFTLVCTMSFLVFSGVFKGDEYVVLQGVSMTRDYYFDTGLIVMLCVMLTITMLTLELSPFSGLDLALLMRMNRGQIWVAKQLAIFMIALSVMSVLTMIQTSVLYLTPYANTQAPFPMYIKTMSGFILFYVVVMSGIYQVTNHSFAPFLVFSVWLIHALSLGHTFLIEDLSHTQRLLSYIIVNVHYTGDTVMFLVRGASVAWLTLIASLLALRHYLVNDIL